MSNIRIDNIAPSAGGTYRNAPRGIAAAWANFDGTGTPAIRDSENVGSITDNGTGDYTVNFTDAMSDANYSVNYSQYGLIASTWGYIAVNSLSAISVKVNSMNNAGGGQDPSVCCATIMGDLA